MIGRSAENQSRGPLRGPRPPARTGSRRAPASDQQSRVVPDLLESEPVSFSLPQLPAFFAEALVVTHGITAAHLAKFESLQSLSTEELGTLLAACELRIFQPGDAVLTTGQAERALWMLVLGSAHVTLPGQAAVGQTILEAGPGSILGELSFLRAAPHSATVTCGSACTFARLDRVQFDSLAASHPAIAAKLILGIAELTAARLQAADHWMSEFLSGAEQSRFHGRATELRQAFAMNSPTTAVFLGLRT